MGRDRDRYDLLVGPLGAAWFLLRIERSGLDKAWHVLKQRRICHPVLYFMTRLRLCFK